MIGFLGDWLYAIWRVLCESGPYLMLGLALAGFIKVLIPEHRVFGLIGRNDFKSVSIASMVGVPLPLCSCSVLPSAMQLKRSGASKGATTAFLISTPETGVDSIGLTWALMDPLMTVVRPLAALTTALFTGTFVNVLVRRGWDDHTEDARALAKAEEACSGAPAGPDASRVPEPSHPEHSHSHEPPPPAAGGRVARPVRQALRYGFGPLLDDLSTWFILGFVISGLITIVVPDDLFTRIPDHLSWMTMALMLCIGIPLYICASASTPVAAALVAKGLDPGAALVFLLAGPATSVATMLVVRSFLGKRVLLIYVGSIALFSVLFGSAVNVLYGALDLDLKGAVSGALGEPLSPFGIVCGVVLTGLLLASAARVRFLAWLGERVRRVTGPLGFDPTSAAGRAVLAVVVLAAWASTAVSPVGPGEVGFVTRFGDVRRTVEQPGLVVHLPRPFERLETVRVAEVREATFGFERNGAQPMDPFDAFSLDSSGRGRADESEIVTGDEVLIRASWTVHWRVTDAYRFRFGVGDPEALLRACSESAVRRMAAHRAADALLVASRAELQAEAEALLQAELDALDSGIEVVALRLVELHAPPQVHYSFRDVASALEDKERHVLRGKSYQVRELAAARAEAARVELAAQAALQTRVDVAAGEANAFERMAAAFERHPGAMLRRLCDVMARVGQKARLVVLLGDSIDVVFGRAAMPDDAALAPSASPAAQTPPRSPPPAPPAPWDEEHR